MDFQDRLTLDRPRRDSAGNLIASVLAARAGIQDYAGVEVGRPDLPRVAVYRAPEEVFARESMRSFAAAPVTVDHPPASITPANWRDFAVGEVASDDIVKDGEAVRVPFLLRDAAAIATVEGGKREISMGYSCELVWGDGIAPDGTPYQARQTGIRINHLAIVDKARGGAALRIGDGERDGGGAAADTDTDTDTDTGADTIVTTDTLGDHAVPTRIILFDGRPLAVTDAAAAVLSAQAATIVGLGAARHAAEAAVARHATTIAARDAEIAELRAAAASAPADIRAAGRAWQQAVEAARRLAPRLVLDEAMDEAAIKAAVVAARLGDRARGWTPAQVEISFATMLADAAPPAPADNAPDRPDPLRRAIAGQPLAMGDAMGAAVAARAARIARFATAHHGNPAGPHGSPSATTGA